MARRLISFLREKLGFSADECEQVKQAFLTEQCNRLELPLAKHLRVSDIKPDKAALYSAKLQLNSLWLRRVDHMRIINLHQGIRRPPTAERALRDRDQRPRAQRLPPKARRTLQAEINHIARRASCDGAARGT